MFKKTITPEFHKKMRLRAGLTREELADLMQCSPGSIVNRETHDSNISLGELERFMLVVTSTPEERKKVRSGFRNLSTMLNSFIGVKDKRDANIPNLD